MKAERVCLDGAHFRLQRLDNGFRGPCVFTGGLDVEAVVRC